MNEYTGYNDQIKEGLKKKYKLPTSVIKCLPDDRTVLFAIEEICKRSYHEGYIDGGKQAVDAIQHIVLETKLDDPH